jgi:hypothetical protein
MEFNFNDNILQYQLIVIRINWIYFKYVIKMVILNALN